MAVVCKHEPKGEIDLTHEHGGFVEDGEIDAAITLFNGHRTQRMGRILVCRMCSGLYWVMSDD